MQNAFSEEPEAAHTEIAPVFPVFLPPPSIFYVNAKLYRASHLIYKLQLFSDKFQLLVPRDPRYRKMFILESVLLFRL